MILFMKKVLLTLAMSLFLLAGYAQSNEAALKALEKAKNETLNPKKATQSASWVKLANAFKACYDVPTTGIWQGEKEMEVQLMLKGQPRLSSTTVEAAGKTLEMESYEDKDLYFDENGVLVAWKVKKPLLEGDILSLAYDAYNKAYELDSKGSAQKNIAEGLQGLHQSYINDGYNAYTLGEYKEASEYFGKCVMISAHPLVNVVDSVYTYYTAVTAAAAADYPRAIEYLVKCIEIDYVEKGDVYASLADCYKHMGDTAKAIDVLNTGFAKFPVNQGILVALINLYMESGDQPTKLFELLRTAQENEPSNASLFYAEGNVYVKLGDYEKAIEAYNKSSEIDPNYFWGPFSTGKTYYDMAVAIQEEANMEMDDAKYNALLAKLDGALENAIAPLEKAFTLTEDKDLKAYVAEVLKNIYFRFRDRSEEYKANYQKYNSFLGN